MTTPPPFHLRTADDLRRRGSVKWSTAGDVLGAGVAEMDFPASEPVVAALRSAVDAQAFGYLPPSVAAATSRATAHRLRSAYRWDVPASAVHLVADVHTAFRTAVEHFSAPGSPVVVPTPAYMPFLAAPGILGRPLVEVPMARAAGGWTLDLDAISRALEPAGGLVVLVNPHNPTGHVHTRAELLALADVVAATGARVLADEIHAPLVLPGATHVPYASLSATTAAHTVTAVSASKAWNLPGLKCAQLVTTNPADDATWERIAVVAGQGASTLGAIATTAAYTEGGPWLEEVRDYLDGTRALLVDLVAEHLPEVRWTPPQGTYLAWLDCRGLDLAMAPATFFAERAGVAGVDGAACGAVGAGWLRYNFATPRPLVEQAVRHMGAAAARA
ncbi:MULTISPECIES: MalY/PatB family protein [unclassified Actinotalea]|uniref:MalY/PatB family protein n=1 Tax=unclassified Actinotalea TaxID=2638618 RepID=UPI0015F6D88A|nr:MULTISPECIES: aminotransferase class I/II-fold pyridoxal phosphate-dependent enzyme [unclassified Actinotalea]